MIYIYIRGRQWGTIDDDGWVFHNMNRLGKLELSGDTLFATGSLRQYFGSIDKSGFVFSTGLDHIATIKADDFIVTPLFNQIGYAHGFWSLYYSLKNKKTSSGRIGSSGGSTAGGDPGGNGGSGGQGGSGGAGCITVIVCIILFFVFYSCMNADIDKMNEQRRAEIEYESNRDDHDFDYEEATDPDYYELEENVYFTYYYCPDLYDSYHGAGIYGTKYYKSFEGMNYGSDSIAFERSEGLYDDDYTYDEYLENYADEHGFFNDKHEIESQTSYKDAEDGRSHMVVRKRTGERYTTEYHIVAYDEGIFTVEITYHDPKTEEEKNWINYLLYYCHV